jgi:NTE family protein
VFTGGGDQTADYRVSRLELSLAVGRELGTWGELRGGVLRGSGDYDVLVGAPDLPEDDFDTGGLFARFSVDTLDDVDFPHRGYSGFAEYFKSEEALGADDNYQRLESRLFAAKTWDRHTLVGGAGLGTTLAGGELPVYDRFALGGFLNLSGYADRELSGSYSALGALVYYYRLDRSTGLLQLPTYLGGSLELGNVWQDRDDFGTDLISAGSLFLGVDTFFGPLYLAYGRAEGGRDSAYLFLGTRY